MRRPTLPPLGGSAGVPLPADLCCFPFPSMGQPRRY